jgi:hypothetical protein
MAARPKKDEAPKRLNRVVGAGEALQRALDPVFRKRGFASRDIITHWAAMAPKPYDRIAVPDRLVWPRGERNAGGAVLYLRCAAGHALALQHEGQMIAAAVNRYFGYVLVGAVRLSAEPFSVNSADEAETYDEPDATAAAALDETVAEVGDDGLRDALRRLGSGIMGRKAR